ncbi:hypothetical protein HRR77_003789 [Exophiala dermatitidis]|nr:hypothetical protein HRR77_003789 [Exophiala dermatitidis]
MAATERERLPVCLKGSWRHWRLGAGYQPCCIERARSPSAILLFNHGNIVPISELHGPKTSPVTLIIHFSFYPLHAQSIPLLSSFLLCIRDLRLQSAQTLVGSETLRFQSRMASSDTYGVVWHSYVGAFALVSTFPVDIHPPFHLHSEMEKDLPDIFISAI